MIDFIPNTKDKLWVLENGSPVQLTVCAYQSLLGKVQKISFAERPLKDYHPFDVFSSRDDAEAAAKSQFRNTSDAVVPEWVTDLPEWTLGELDFLGSPLPSTVERRCNCPLELLLSSGCKCGGV